MRLPTVWAFCSGLTAFIMDLSQAMEASSACWTMASCAAVWDLFKASRQTISPLQSRLASLAPEPSSPLWILVLQPPLTANFTSPVLQIEAQFEKLKKIKIYIKIKRNKLE